MGVDAAVAHGVDVGCVAFLAVLATTFLDRPRRSWPRRIASALSWAVLFGIAQLVSAAFNIPRLEQPWSAILWVVLFVAVAAMWKVSSRPSGARARSAAESGRAMQQ